MGSWFPTRSQTHIPCTGSTVLFTGPPGKSQNKVLISPFLFTLSDMTTGKFKTTSVAHFYLFIYLGHTAQLERWS